MRLFSWLRFLIFFEGVTGRLRVSREGFNGTLTGPYDGIRGFTRDMRSYPGGYFEEMKDGDDFKYTDNLPVGQVPSSPSSSTTLLMTLLRPFRSSKCFLSRSSSTTAWVSTIHPQ